MNLPPQTQQFVQQMIANGDYASPDDVVIAALDLMRVRQERLEKLRSEIQEGLDDSVAGRSRALDVTAIVAEGRRRLEERSQIADS